VGFLWPHGVVFLEQRGQPLGLPLFPGEERLLGRPTAKRLAEFASTRALAREALAALGLPAQPIAKGKRGEPLFPAGVVGSLTHTEGYRGCALAFASRFRALGLDAEPNREPPARLEGRIASPAERRILARLPVGPAYLRLLFCAKEALFKAASTLGAPLGSPLEVGVELEGGPRAGRFRPLGGGPLAQASCRWQLAGGVLICAVAVASEPARGA